MFDYLASLAALFLFMFSGAATFLLLPITIPIHLALKGRDKFEPLGYLFSDLLSAVFFTSLVALLTRDYQHRHGDLQYWYLCISSLLVLIFSVETAIDKRQDVIDEAKKWTEYTQFLPEIQYWKVFPVLSLPLFLLFFAFPKINFPYLYKGFDIVLKWLFHIRFIGFGLQLVCACLGVALFLGCLKFLFMRVLLVVTGQGNTE